MALPGFNDLIDSEPLFDQDSPNQISDSNMNVTVLYAKYIDWLITKNLHAISIRHLLQQIYIINAYVLNKSYTTVNQIHTLCPISEDQLKEYEHGYNQISQFLNKQLNEFNNKRAVFDTDSVIVNKNVTKYLAKSLISFAVGAALFGTCFAPELSIAGIYSLGALAGICLCYSVSSLSKAIEQNQESNKLHNKFVSTHVNTVATISRQISTSISSLMPAVRASISDGYVSRYREVRRGTEVETEHEYAINLSSVKNALPRIAP